MKNKPRIMTEGSKAGPSRLRHASHPVNHRYEEPPIKAPSHRQAPSKPYHLVLCSHLSTVSLWIMRSRGQEVYYCY
ncbi:unnamed protein product [Eruca vesicaria subsp. sativa]|uniref:Uncharacterized protein n=1 Tax=Eruca vesicaria subsp. sativa TaxID=29727 RepID=A0ABC8JMX9_ERUVS|nr:unnamed protein product [Eruca vesicaria subsp. sativa]